MLKNLEDIILLARNRKENPVSGSYTNQLLNDKSLSKAKILEEINEKRDAYKIYLQILDIDKFNLDAIKNIAEFLEEDGSTGQAINYYEKALQLDQENEEIINKIAELKNIAK